ncbi:jg4821 [Pararge aegeria aegeria]|uniref:Jg4821 protein n=1 Tax=Pararge aegeria aegeria TaxID=348720 RepID=A0A8S4SAZ6_9NEOP|nr:jg4821 [Pararge aegeria aegeria]
MALLSDFQRRLQLQTGHWVGPLGPWCQVRVESRQCDQACDNVAAICGVAATWNARGGLRPSRSEVELTNVNWQAPISQRGGSV